MTARHQGVSVKSSTRARNAHRAREDDSGTRVTATEGIYARQAHPTPNFHEQAENKQSGERRTNTDPTA